MEVETPAAAATSAARMYPPLLGGDAACRRGLPSAVSDIDPIVGRDQGLVKRLTNLSMMVRETGR